MKYSVSTKYNMEIITVKLQKNEQPVENEILWIRSQRIPGMVPVEIEEKGNAYCFNYNVTGFISMKKYSRDRITKNDFVLLLDSVVKSFELLEKSGLTYLKLLLDDKGIYINPVTKKAVFVYVPINSYTNNMYIEQFLLHLIKCFKYQKNEDLQFLQQLSDMCNNPQGVSWDMLKQFIKNLTGRQSADTYNENNNNNVQPQRTHTFCGKCGAKNSISAKFCVKCGNRLENIANKPVENKVQQDIPMQFNETPNTPPVYTPPSYTPPQSYTPPNTDIGATTEDLVDFFSGDDGETVVLKEFEDEEDAPTTMLGMTNPAPVIKYPYLIRLSTQERIQTNKDVFVVGKGKVSDYIIKGNSAISRKHLSIITRDNHYFIIDNNSTNRTYINDKLLDPQTEYEVFEEDTIKMADEDFIFGIDNN